MVSQIYDKGQCNGPLDMPSAAVRGGGTGEELDEAE